jgi:DNA-binding transcriptional ArsR family regulator
MTTKVGQQTQKTFLNDLFASAARAAVLRVFMLDPTRAYYQRQLEAATGLPIRAIQRELDRLTQAGLLYRRDEGNRAYFQVDRDHVFFPELRSMVMKSSTPADQLRAALVVDDEIRLAFLDATGGAALLVFQPGARTSRPWADGLELTCMSSEEFTRALAEDHARLRPFLDDGADLLGRRDDVVWRSIAAAGFNVRKGAGVP